MSRAIRRQQGGSQQEGGGGGGRLRPFGSKQPRQTRGNRPSPQRKGFRLGVPNWIAEIWSELRKVTWPTRDETAYLTMVVIIVAVAIGVVLGVIDVFFNELVDRLLFD